MFSINAHYLIIATISFLAINNKFLDMTIRYILDCRNIVQSITDGISYFNPNGIDKYNILFY